MIFTNLTGAGMYMQCCHREVAPGGSFIVPWYEVKDNRAVRMAMLDGALAWKSEDGEPEIPGSPPVCRGGGQPDVAKADDSGRNLAERMAADDAAVRANMSRMGRFKVPQSKPRRKVAAAVEREKPVTLEDVIADDKPKSLADIVRHNKAVRMAGGKKA